MMNNLRITLDKLPRILKRELDPAADILNSYDEDELPPRIYLKRDTRDKEEKRVQLWKDSLQAKGRRPLFETSVLAEPIFSPIELDEPRNEEEAKIARFIKPKAERFLWVIREGLSIADACKIVGWKYENVLKWITDNRGNLGKCVEVAQIEHKVFHASRVNNAEYGYQASTWMLERKYKDEFSKEVKITTKNEGEEQIIKFGDKEIRF